MSVMCGIDRSEYIHAVNVRRTESAFSVTPTGFQWRVCTGTQGAPEDRRPWAMFDDAFGVAASAPWLRLRQSSGAQSSAMLDWPI
jgi:hypothetical protein